MTDDAALPDWPRAHGDVLATAAIRTVNDDFRVTEFLSFSPSGSGEHDWLWIEKDGANTAWLANELARHAGVRPVDAGYAGLKDRHAVTRQWFSVRRRSASGTDWSTFERDGISILEITRHDRKLKRGAHDGNRFRIAIRGRGFAGAGAGIGSRLAAIGRAGVPNYFGPQRFGIDAGNLDLAAALFDGARLRRSKRGFAISAARALLFNRILAYRVADGSWSTVLPGDLANLDGSGSVFAVDAADDELERRAAALDIHPSGTLWGRGAPLTRGAVARLEMAATGTDVRFRSGLESLDVAASSRPLRLRVSSLSHELDDDTLWLEFTLPKGGFATSVIRELVATDT